MSSARATSRSACGKSQNQEATAKKELDVSRRIICRDFWTRTSIESSLSVPRREFARAVVPPGTTAIVTDPHEITNVAGTDGRHRRI